MEKIDLKSIYRQLNDIVFDGNLPECRLEWRHKATVNHVEVGGYTKMLSEDAWLIAVSRRSVKRLGFWWVVGLMIHEMTHLEIMLEGDLVELHGEKFAKRIRKNTRAFIGNAMMPPEMEYCFKVSCSDYFMPR